MQGLTAALKVIHLFILLAATFGRSFLFALLRAANGKVEDGPLSHPGGVIKCREHHDFMWEEAFP